MALVWPLKVITNAFTIAVGSAVWVVWGAGYVIGSIGTLPYSLGPLLEKQKEKKQLLAVKSTIKDPSNSQQNSVDRLALEKEVLELDRRLVEMAVERDKKLALIGRR